MAKNFTARIRLVATDRASATITAVQGRMAALGAFLKRNLLLALGGATVAFVALVKVMKSVVTAANVQEDAIKKLDTALAPLGATASGVSKRMQEFASQLQGITTAGDEVIISGIALLASFTKNEEELRGATKAALDLSAATGQNLKSAFLLMGRAASGETSTLSRYGITLEKGLDPSEKFAAALVKINEQFGGQAQAKAETFSGRIAQLGNAIGDTAELIGFLITKSEGLNSIFEGLTTTILNFNAVMGDPILTEQGKALLAIEDATKRVATAQLELTNLQEGSVSPLGFLVDGLRNATGQTSRLFEAEIELAKAQQALTNAQQESLKIFRDLNTEKKESLEIDKEALKAAEKLGVITQEVVNTALDDKRKALVELRENAIALGISDQQLADIERGLVEEQLRLNAAFEASNGSLTTYNAILEKTTQALFPVVDTINLATLASEGFNVETERTIQLQGVLQGTLAFTRQQFEQILQTQGRAAAINAVLGAGGRQGVGNRLILPGGGSVLLPSGFGAPKGFNVDGTKRRF